MRSDTGTRDVQQAQKELLEYLFLSLIGQYIRPRKFKSILDLASNSSHSSPKPNAYESDERSDVSEDKN